MLIKSFAAGFVAFVFSLCFLSASVWAEEADTDESQPFDFEFSPKAFDSSNAGKSGYGFAYSVKSNDAYFNELLGEKIAFLTVGFLTEGNYALDADTNPNDFLTSKLNLGGRYTWAWGGDVPSGGDEPSLPGGYTPVYESRLNVAFRATSSYEADQSFDNTQWLYGGQLDLNLSPKSDPILREIFIPAQMTRLIRYLINGEGSKVSGTWPDISLTLDRVQPLEDDDRKAAGDTSDFTRVGVDVSYGDSLGHLLGRDLWFEARYRYFHEIGASAVIRSAGLDTSNWYQLRIVGQKKDQAYESGPFVAFSSGQLPFDLKSQDTFSVGWNFKWGGKE